MARRESTGFSFEDLKKDRQRRQKKHSGFVSEEEQQNQLEQEVTALVTKALKIPQVVDKKDPKIAYFKWIFDLASRANDSLVYDQTSDKIILGRRITTTP